MASSTSSSLTTRPGPSSFCASGKVTSPGVGASSASQIEPESWALVSFLPLFSERARSSKPAGSPACTVVPGLRPFTPSATPVDRPPPEQGAATASSVTPSALACSASSRPAVPWPVRIQGWS